MNQKTLILVLIIFFIGWATLIWSASLPFIQNRFNQNITLDYLTYQMTGILVFCQSEQTCLRYGEPLTFNQFISVNEDHYKWPSFNFIIMGLIWYPFFNIVPILFNKGSFMFGQKGLKNLVYQLFFVNFLVPGVLILFKDLYKIDISFESGFYVYIVSLLIIFVSVFIGIKGSNLDRGSNYQR